MHGPRTLRSRLFGWLFGGILVALSAGALVVMGTRPEPTTGAESMARNVSARLAAAWDEPEAARAYVAEVRDVTGFEVRLVREPHKLPPRVHRAAAHGLYIVPENPHHIFIPVVRGSSLAGALEMEKFGPRAMPWPWWRVVLALALVVVVLSAVAGRVANQLARPLERLAHAADRFGGGDLAFRAEVGSAHRWVAAEVREVALSFNRMANRVEAMVRGQRELLGAISHELRSPLGRARVALEIARDRLSGDTGSRTLAESGPERERGSRTLAESGPERERGSPERSPARALDDIETQLGSVDVILGDLLDVTRAGLADLRKETRGFVQWLRARAAEEPAPPQVLVEATPEAEALAFPFDAALLGRTVHNLLVNARAYGHPVDLPIFVLAAREPGGRAGILRVVVRDRGPGFPPGFAERAFEPFVRGDAARARPTAGAGSGLGLAIVKRVVEAHGGRVFARNAASHDVPGAEVGFELPISDSATRSA
jgi:signal transduction histidine kinase